MRLAYALFIFFPTLVSNQGVDLQQSSSATIDQVKYEQNPIETQAAIQHEKTQPFSLTPHKAEYEIIFDQEKSTALNIDNVAGNSSVELVKTRDGWSFTQHLCVQIVSTDGATTTLQKDIISWESPHEMSFRVEEYRNGSLESTFQGRAEHSENIGWQVYFETPETDGFILHHLNFPISHLENILQAIQKGQATLEKPRGKVILSNQNVFDPSCGVNNAVKIDTVITNTKPKTVNINNQQHQIWHLQQAPYNIKSNNAVSDYAQSHLDVTADGIITSMDTSWGDVDANKICVNLKLKTITIYN